MTHTSNKPHTCDTCRKSFTHSCYLKEHYVINHIPEICVDSHSSTPKHFIVTKWLTQLRNHTPVISVESHSHYPVALKHMKRHTRVKKRIPVESHTHTEITWNKEVTCLTQVINLTYAIHEESHSHTDEKPSTIDTCGKSFTLFVHY